MDAVVCDTTAVKQRVPPIEQPSIRPQALVHFTLHAGHSTDATPATLLVQDLGRQLS